MAIPRTASPQQTFGMTAALSFSVPKCSTILMGPTFASNNGNATADEIFALKKPLIRCRYVVEVREETLRLWVQRFYSSSMAMMASRFPNPCPPYFSAILIPRNPCEANSFLHFAETGAFFASHSAARDGSWARANLTETKVFESHAQASQQGRRMNEYLLAVSLRASCSSVSEKPIVPVLMERVMVLLRREALRWKRAIFFLGFLKGRRRSKVRSPTSFCLPLPL